jgi:hypothetical protein
MDASTDPLEVFKLLGIDLFDPAGADQPHSIPIKPTPMSERAGESEVNQILVLPIVPIRPPENDRVCNPGDIADLAGDNKKRGLLEPIVITTMGYILSGHWRYAGAAWQADRRSGHELE